MITMISPDGQAVEVQEHKVDRNLARGFTMPMAQKEDLVQDFHEEDLEENEGSE